MTRNTKEISLIQIRTGDLSQLPKALHQSEFGLAKDANRLFIGNAANTELSNRTTEFPYQNLEILTEFSELKDFFKYSYENNITTVNGDDKRSDYKEYLPIIINCMTLPSVSNDSVIKINGTEVELTPQLSTNEIISKINEKSDLTHTYATMVSSTAITFMCFTSSLVFESVSGDSVNAIFNLPTTYNTDILMPIRKATEKLDDFLNITDFGIKGDGVTNNSDKIFNSLSEVYKNFNDTQFFRNVFFPAGTYIFDTVTFDGTSESVYYPFPIISNMHISGEGIDRTVIYAPTDYKASLLRCVDDNLTISSHDLYGEVGPKNVLIEDMTFETLNGIVCEIELGTNITFNRVKFKSSSINDIIKIVGIDGKYACDITFNNCIFEDGNRSIFVSDFVKNVTITNCLFKNSKSRAIQIGDDGSDNLIYGINLNSNIFENCLTNASATDTAIIKLGKNANYVSIHQSIFDKDVIERTGIKVPYIDFDGENRRNYIDTLDPNTDEKKILKFKFTQPQWEYINYLCNSDGKVVLTVDGNDSDITSDNGLNITQDSSQIVIKSVKSGDVIIAQDDDSDLVLGRGTNGNSNGNIVLNKTLDLNDNKISNASNNEHVIIETATNKWIEVNPSTSDALSYSQRIINQPNAIPNVEFVKKQTSTTAIFKIDNSITEKENFDLITFNKEDFGDNVYIKNVSINITKPFFNVYEHKKDAVNYTINYVYYAGDVVTDGTVYGVVNEEHTATTNLTVAIQNNLVTTLNNTELKDVKYIDIVSSENGLNKVNLFKKPLITSSLNSDDNEYVYINNILNTNTFGLNPNELDENMLYGDDVYIKHQGKIFRVLPFDDESVDTINITSTELHNTSVVEMVQIEGVTYKYDFPKSLFDTTMGKMIYGQQNYSGKTLSLEFADKDFIQMTNVDKTQLNPCGEMIISIEYSTAEMM